jgi:outer membrane lipoprotein-sorting protein
MIARFLIVIFSFATLFAETGDEILNKIETALAGPNDYEGKAQMVLANLDGSGRETRELKLWFAGNDKRVIKFISPPGIEGIGLLTESADSMYLYLPAQNKIRKIEGGIKSEEFQGTDFSYDEMGSYEYRKDFTATVISEDTDTYTLKLSRKQESVKSYDVLVMVVDKTTYIPRKVDFSRAGKLKKVLSILEIKREQNFIVPVRIRMENPERSHYTEIVISEMKFNQGLEGRDIFTKRFLKKRAQ